MMLHDLFPLRNSLGSFLLPSPFRLYISHDHDDGRADGRRPKEEKTARAAIEDLRWNHAAMTAA